MLMFSAPELSNHPVAARTGSAEEHIVEATTERAEQQDLFETQGTRSLLDQLLSDSKLYTRSADYQQLLDFVVRLRNFAPFNAMLLQVQKPGLSYAASARDWRERFDRKPKEGARPLLILWPFGPVALVYDVQDTEGKDLPKDVWSFFAQGEIDEEQLKGFETLVRRKNIEWCWFDRGDQDAGYIRIVRRSSSEEPNVYRMFINRNHPAATKFDTLTHELGHLFLGHIGPDKDLGIPERASTTLVQRELEAESVAYLTCKRNRVEPQSQKYLSHYVKQDTTTEIIDIYQVMRAAGQVESMLGLAAHTKYDMSRRKGVAR
jgi:hypothetical protein